MNSRSSRRGGRGPLVPREAEVSRLSVVSFSIVIVSTSAVCMYIRWVFSSLRYLRGYAYTEFRRSCAKENTRARSFFLFFFFFFCVFFLHLFFVLLFFFSPIDLTRARPWPEVSTSTTSTTFAFSYASSCLNSFSLCIRSICRAMCIFCFAL